METVAVSQAPVVSEASATVAPPVGGATVAALPSAVQDLARFFLSLVLWDGYCVPFMDSPSPLSRTPVSFPTYRAGSPRAPALRQEVEVMLVKGALEIARDPGPGFYSRLFLVEKASGGP